jgi:predicted NBD/HSP70 family sugar kinase
LRTFPKRVSQPASNRTPRLINSSLVLKTIRRLQPISRVDLARASGLQPSTVSLIVEELLGGHWLLEGDAVHADRGRRPRHLTLAQNRCVLSVDIHPRQTSVAIADITGKILWQTVCPLDEDPAKALATLIQVLRTAIKAHPDKHMEGIGICLPGRTDVAATELVFAPNLHWPVVSLKAEIQQATGLRVEMDNVANACALSEVWFADTDDEHDLVVVEVSEGLGTGIFVNGAIARGKGGMAGEFGHIQMAKDGPLCSCGNVGCWETLASNRAAIRFYNQSPGAKKSMTFSRLLRLALAEDPLALAALLRMATNLGHGLRMVAAALAPEEVVIVGEITAAWHRIGPTLEAEMRKHSLAKTTRLRPAYDGGAARLRSAVALVLSKSHTSA